MIKTIGILGILLILFSGCINTNEQLLDEKDARISILEETIKQKQGEIEYLELQVLKKQGEINNKDTEFEAEKTKIFDFLDNLAKAEEHILDSEASFNKGNEYYDEASFAYERGWYPKVIEHCEKAGENYNSAVFESKTAKALYEKVLPDAPNAFYKKTTEIMVAASEARYNFSIAIFEACENFEFVAVNYDSDDYDMGDAYLKIMNEKIEIHDEWVDKYNDLLTEYEALLETQ